MRAAVLGALGLLGAAACTPVPPLEARLQPWIGRGEAELVTAFGVPAGTYVVGDTKFVQFEQQRTQIIPSDYPFYRPFGRFGPVTMPPATVIIGCAVTFALRGGVVESFSYRGDGCR